jgi:CheY-like chemotaxis protein
MSMRVTTMPKSDGSEMMHVVARPTVLIVDDHETFRDGARAMLESGGFAVVGEAPDGAVALSEAERLQPDIVLLDVQLPGLDGFAVADRLAVDVTA